MAKIIINKANLFHNLTLISNQAGGVDKVSIALKDNAYGHDLVLVSGLLKEFGIKKAVVRTLKEAKQIEKFFEYILVLADNNIDVNEEKFHIALNSFDCIKELPNDINVHIKVDTGMHRNGIMPEELEETIKKLLEKNINVTGVFTHHKCADDIYSDDFDQQNAIFSKVKEQTQNIFKKLSLKTPSFHSSNSSALFRHKSNEEDFVRVGIATYGYIETNSSFVPDLKPVMSLWTKKVSSRTLKKGETVGYGGTYKAQEDMKISTYDIGYGDGFLRINEKQHYVTPKGYKLLGRVSMDYISLNSTDEEVCLFEDAKNLAKLHDTISYEIITTLSKDLIKEIQ